MDFFYPLPNQAHTSNGGFGTYRQILALSRNRDRADARIDHELTGRDSLFVRGSWQNRDPDAFTFESTGANGGAGLTNLGLLDRKSKAITLATGWTRIWSGAVVNEFRGGYSLDERNRRSQFVAGDVGSALRDQVPALAAQAPGFPQFLFAAPNRPSRHSGPAAEHLPRSAAVVVLAEQHHDVAVGHALDEVRRHLHAQLREGRLLDRRQQFEGPVQLHRLGDRQLVRGFPARAAATPSSSSATRAATCRWTRSRTTGRCSPRTTGS